MPAPPTRAADPDLTVVVPARDEAEVLPELVARLRPVLDGLVTGGLAGYEVLVVDDGSTDATPVVLARARRAWPQLRVVRLRAGSGHQAALSAGLARARGRRGVVTMDADLQDPPELLPDLLAAASGDPADPGGPVEVVYAVRSDRSVDGRFKRLTAAAFYRLVRALGGTAPSQAGDFRYTSRTVVDTVLQLPEQHRVLRLVVPELGFRAASVPYARAARGAGRTKYPLRRMVRLSLDAITGSSTAPLRLASIFGLGGAALTSLLLVYALVSFAAGSTVPGWTSTLVVVAGAGTLQLLCLGVLGEYVGRLYVQLQGRPAYLVAVDTLEDGVDEAGG
ncbi:glycosyltransferase family 2 protein [Kineococcus sp. TRM81007]|uniref:glycosyltransferase family 2 protein n=1 Tax=Kineococcus sp. TRM81007 TaxID=2925831 RepID=UPI001F55C672|nr:glycosyltransferase family 2 protein [Kineococcus sp. TRM81007]MCI2240070.1 glycosyltransferase family 2 protein [Kineococcus sp. TRM81007]